MKILVIIFLFPFNLYSQIYKDTFVNKVRLLRDYDNYNENYLLPSKLLNNFSDGFYKVNYNDLYIIIGEVKSGVIQGKLKIYDRYNSNNSIEEERFSDSIIRYYYSDWANNGIKYLSSKEILYNRYYYLSKNYYANLSDTIHYGYKIKLMKIFEFNKIGYIEREYFALKDYRRVGSYKEYFSNGSLKKEACYEIRNCDFKNDSFLFNNNLCKEKIYIESQESFQNTDAIEGLETDVLYNSWYENYVKKQECLKIIDTNYNIKIISYNLNGSKESEVFYCSKSFVKRKEIYYDKDKLYEVKYYRYNNKLQKDELIIKENYKF